MCLGSVVTRKVQPIAYGQLQTLNERQESLLERIASGDSLNEPDDAHLRTTAYALRSRGLITTKKRGGVFNAEVTDRGRLYRQQRVQFERTCAALAALHRVTGMPR